MISRLPTFLICLLLAGSVYSQDTREAEDTRDIDVTELIETVLRLGHIELPFEFYNGRWAEGHLGTYSNVYSDGLRPSPRFDYSYSSSGWNFSAEGFQGDIVTGDDDVPVQLLLQFRGQFCRVGIGSVAKSSFIFYIRSGCCLSLFGKTSGRYRQRAGHSELHSNRPTGGCREYLQ